MTCTAAFAQNVFFGVKSGLPLTDAFQDQTTHGVDVITHAFSESKNYVIGPVVELGLPLGFSVEADALYRPLNLTTDITVVPQPVRHSVTDISSWEFPILGKYHFLHLPIIRPYVEAGPIFRAVGSRGSNLSNAGAALGGGVDIKILRLRVMPEIRYSRWGSDATVAGFTTFPSNLNQAEFLIAIGF
ncbi:MAG TPA: hypothetical protein VEV17_03610 [Bryobacteraceae bacterium]|nr:hypothetical protein [Bryobacteraceae bacterium]